MVDAVRRAEVGDARAIAEVHVAGWQHGYRGLIAQAYLDALRVDERERGWRRALRRGDESVIVLDRDGRVDGFACSGPCRDDDVSDDAGEVYALYVRPASWRSGVGAQLLSAAEAGLEQRVGGPRDPAVLWVLEGNARARTFYEAQGWRADGHRKTDDRPAIGTVPGITLTEVRYRSSFPSSRHSAVHARTPSP